jgi:cell division protein FtsB
VGRRRARAALVFGVSVVLVGFLFAFYFPTRTWLAQRRSTGMAATQLDALSHANQTLSAQANALKDPAVIARIARDQYGMVKPGEKAFVVLPPPSAPTALPKVWPFEQSVTPTGPNASQGQVTAAGNDAATPTTG